MVCQVLQISMKNKIEGNYKKELILRKSGAVFSQVPI